LTSLIIRNGTYEMGYLL